MQKIVTCQKCAFRHHALYCIRLNRRVHVKTHFAKNQIVFTIVVQAESVVQDPLQVSPALLL